MCGIIGVISNKNSENKILEGLKKMEYRGYDSSGISVINNNIIKTHKEEGKIINLENSIKKDNDFKGNIAIGHTRWATHGIANRQNAHPHFTEKVSVVHNGIIENYQEIKDKLTKEGFKFKSQTDTEVITNLITSFLEQNFDKKTIILKVLSIIEGSFALGIIFNDENDLLIAAKKGSPLLIGFGENENYIASDYFAINDYVQNICYLEDGDIAFLTKDKIDIFDINQNKITREIEKIDKNSEKISKDGFDHFMLKEIYEQPKTIQKTLAKYLDKQNQQISLPEFSFDLKKIDKITIIACGTSFYAGMVGKYLIESLARINVEVDIASEFRYRNSPQNQNSLTIFISQSGETADTIAAMKYVKYLNQKSLAIVNAPKSTMAHLADDVMLTTAGVEIGVASTKAYTAQIAILILLALNLGQKRGVLKDDKVNELIYSLNIMPNLMQNILSKEYVEKIKKISYQIKDAKNILYIGRGISYGTSMEAALKLKELSYINSSAIAAGELKHGTIALIDEQIYVIAIAPENELFDKISSNIAEISARNGNVILISSKGGANNIKNIISNSLQIAKNSDIIAESLLYVIPVQLIAYYVALFKGNDVDQPRNLAKSVTVE
jgi:glucosamine--fructose-6-phosphate aminotransferase (isomerizing)